MLFQVNSLSNSADDRKNGISTSDTSAEEAVGPSSKYKLPKSSTSGQVESLYARQTKLEAVMIKLTEKVEAMDSKLDKIMSLLLPGHGDDAKKGEKSNPDDVLILGTVEIKTKTQPLMLLRIYQSS